MTDKPDTAGLSAWRYDDPAQQHERAQRTTDRGTSTFVRYGRFTAVIWTAAQDDQRSIELHEHASEQKAKDWFLAHANMGYRPFMSISASLPFPPPSPDLRLSPPQQSMALDTDFLQSSFRRASGSAGTSSLRSVGYWAVACLGFLGLPAALTFIEPFVPSAITAVAAGASIGWGIASAMLPIGGRRMLRKWHQSLVIAGLPLTPLDDPDYATNAEATPPASEIQEV